MSYESVVKEDSPKGYWRLGEPSGTKAEDSSGNAQNGTYKNAPTLGVAGAITGDANTAASFASASKQWVSVPDSATLDLGDVLTYEAWVKRASTGTGQTILDKGGGSLIVRFLANNKILVRRNGVANICESTVAITDTTSWHHVVVTKNGATVKIYIDGTDVTGTVTNSTLVNTAIVLGIGAADAGEEEFLNGSIDEVAVYGTALSKARVEAHHAAGIAKTVEGKGAGTGTGTGTASGTRARLAQGAGTGAGTGSAAGTRERQGKASGEGSGSGTGAGVRTAQGKGEGEGSGTGDAEGTRGRFGKGSGTGTGSGTAEGTATGSHLSYVETVLGDTPSGYWRLDEAEGATVAADSSGNGNDGAYKNSVELEIIGGLVTDADTSAAFNTGGTVEKDHVLVPDAASMDLGDVFTLEAWIRRDGIGLTDCIIDKGEGAFIFRFDGEDHLLLRRNSVADIARSTAKIADAGWHHVVATKNGAVVHLYIDGADITGTVTNQTCANTAIALTIGASNAGEEDYFRGGIDEPAVYPVALTAGEVEAHFKAGFVPIPPENLEAPTVSGSPERGQRLAADKGAWEYNPASYAYQWQVSDKEGTGFVGIVGASTSSYVVQHTDVGRYLRCVVTAKNASGSTDAASAPGHVTGTASAARLWLGDSLEDYFRQSAPGAITDVSDPGGSGRRVFRFDVHKADVEPITPTKDPRAQLAGPILEIGEGFVRYPFVDGSEVWVEFAFRLPGTELPAEQPSWFQIIQLFGPPFEGVAPWAIKAANDFTELLWQRNATYGFDIPWEAPTSRDNWTRGLLHLRLAADGWVEMWIDGEPITFFAPGSSFNPHGEPEATRLEMATLDESNDGAYGSTIFLQNYWEAGSFEEAVIYHEPPSVWLGLSGVGPIAVTNPAGSISANGAVLRGEVDGKGAPSTYWFEYTTLADFEDDEWSKALATPKGSVGSGELQAVKARVGGLKRDEDYVFRLRVATPAGEALGDGEKFRAVFNAIAVGREYPPLHLAVRISDPQTGRTIQRWAADEGLTENIINDLGLSSEMQGGSKESSGTLAREPRIRWSDLTTYLDKTIYGAGNEECWWGRINKPEGSDGNQSIVTPKGVGHLAALEDDNAVQIGFINSDLSEWGSPSLDRQKALALAGVNYRGPGVSVGWQGSEPEGTPPHLLMDFTHLETAEGTPMLGYAVFDSKGCGIGAVLYELAVLTGPEGAAAWLDQIQMAADSVFGSAYKAGADLDATSGQGSAEAEAGANYAAVASQYTDPVGGTTMTDLHGWLLKVLGPHDLALRGTWPNVGFTAKQMLEVAVPQFSYLEARSEDIEDDEFVIPHAWFPGPEGTIAGIVKELTKYGLLDWFVYEGKRFQLRFPGTYGRKWVASPGPAELKEEGEDGDRLWRDIVVAWPDADGTTKTVGPPGSGKTFESAGLEITDPDHPAVRANITRRDILVAKGGGDLPSSIALGENWLDEANKLSHSGTCNLSAYVMDARTGAMCPVYLVKAGDEIWFPGSNDQSYRRITHVDYDHNEVKAACTLDAPPDGLAAVQERFQVELQTAGVA